MSKPLNLLPQPRGAGSIRRLGARVRVAEDAGVVEQEVAAELQHIAAAGLRRQPTAEHVTEISPEDAEPKERPHRGAAQFEGPIRRERRVRHDREWLGILIEMRLHLGRWREADDQDLDAAL